MDTNRRQWLFGCISLPVLAEALAARDHAQQAVASASRSFQIFNAPTAADVEALAAQIIPSTDGPGATEAGVVHFIDRALLTFASDDREAFRGGLQETDKTRQKLFPASTSISALNHDQQIQLMHAIEATAFFAILRTLTVMGFLLDPSYGGNRNGVGWKQIGFDPQMVYQHPFGYYDAEISTDGGTK